MTNFYSRGGWYSPYNGLQAVPASRPTGNFYVPSFRPPADDGRSMMIGKQLGNLIKYQLRMLGVVLCVSSAFLLGLALANLLVLMQAPGQLTCLSLGAVLPATSPLSSLSYAIHVIPIIPPFFVFISSIFCLVIKKPRETLMKLLKALTILNLVLLMPLYIIFAILGILQALGCSSTIIPLMKLIVPVLMVVFGVFVHLILIYLIVVVSRIIHGHKNSRYTRRSSSYMRPPSSPSITRPAYYPARFQRSPYPVVGIPAYGVPRARTAYPAYSRPLYYL